jgi:predicted alpha/beta hydrolase family esterase
MNRRTFTGMMVAGAASPLLHSLAIGQPAPKARNIVLVPGLFAEGSCWSEVIARLQPKDIQVTAVQNLLTTPQEAIETTHHDLALRQGPAVLVAHSFAGMIVTEAGVDPTVSALIYVAARAPDAGADYPPGQRVSNAASHGYQFSRGHCWRILLQTSKIEPP